MADPANDMSTAPAGPALRRLSGTRYAFSLMEMLIVLTIIAIVAAAVLPMIGGTDGAKLRAAARMMQADLAYAQNESVTHSSDLRLMVFDTTNSRYHVAAVSAAATPLTHPIGGGNYAVQYGTGMAEDLAGVTISAVSLGGDDRVRFERYGQLDQATDATITLSAGARNVTLTIDDATGDTTIGNIN